MADHYAALGLAPYAAHSAVRAAYLDLMRQYHPDINSSAEAASRAREVTAAYEVLGDPDSRTDYDLARARAHTAAAEPRAPAWGSPHALTALASLAGAGLLSLFYLLPSAPDARVEKAALVNRPPAPQQRAHPPHVQPLPRTIEPTRRAEKLPAPAPVEVARSPAPAEVTPSPPPPPAAPKRSPAPIKAKRVPQPAIPAPPPRIEPQRPVARPNNDADLAGLDRHLGMLLRQSVRRADAARQQRLYRDHYRFIDRLNLCSTEACKKREYLSRMGEVTSTMEAPAKPR